MNPNPPPGGRGPLHRLIAICSPKPLRGDDFERLGVERDDIQDIFRPDVRAIEHLRHFGYEDPKLLLFGGRGTGKSTELARIGHAFGRDYLITGLDLSDTGVVTREQPSAEELLLFAGLAIAETAHHVVGFDTKPFVKEINKVARTLMDDTAAARFDAAKLISNLALFGTTIIDGGAGVVIDLLGRAAGAARFELDLGGVIRPSGDAKPGRDLLGIVNRLIQRVTDEAGRRPLLLIDELDKAKAQADDCIRLLTDHGLLADLKCPAALAGPSVLADQTEVFAEHELECIQSYHVRCWQTYEPSRLDPEGITKLTDVVTQRVRATLDSSATLEDLVNPAACALLAQMSGGVLRELMALTQVAARQAIINGHESVELSDAKAAVARRRRARELMLTKRDFKLLAEAKKTQELPDDPRVGQLLARSNLLVYSNERSWCYPHSLLYRLDSNA